MKIHTHWHIHFASITAMLACQLNAFAANDNNPVSRGVVEDIVTDAVTRSSNLLRLTPTNDTISITYSTNGSTIKGNYVAGGGISIDGNTITATGADQPYTAGDGMQLDGTEFNVLVDGSTLSINSSNQLKGNYTGSNGVSVSGSSIKGVYGGSNGIQVNGSTISNILSTSSSATIITNGSGELVGNYQAGTGITITDNIINSTASSYTAGDGLQLDGTEFNVLLDGSTLSINGSNELQANYTGSNGVSVSGSTISGDYNAGPGIIIENQNTILSGENYVAVGDYLNGGVVTHISNADSSGKGTHGLIIGSFELPIEILTSSDVIYASSYGYGAGLSNTLSAYAQSPAAYAPALALQYSNSGGGSRDEYNACQPAFAGNLNVNSITLPGCYGGWFLPTYYETVLAMKNYDQFKGSLQEQLSVNDCYWTSTTDINNGYTIAFYYTLESDGDIIIGAADINGTQCHARPFSYF